ncbi:phage portal protein [Rickettsiaceae bacterium]|nr:phage portal protein [Rickettsiaceae bacterium]
MFKSYFSKFSNPKHKKAGGVLDIPFMPYAKEDIGSVTSYRNNVIVHRCISLIASSASHIPWHIYKESGHNRKLLAEHRAAQLLKKPSAEKSGADFFTENISSLLLYGNSYILSSHAEQSQPFELHNIHPNSIEHISTRTKLIAYKYRAGDIEKTFRIDPLSRISKILHLRNYNPSDQQNGLSSLNAAAKPIHLHSKIMDWNKSLLKNAARPSGALIFQDGNGYLTDEQFERLQQQFYDNFSGSSNSGKPLILEGGLKWQETSNAERFEKFIELKDSSARDIAIAFNVPPQLLGINGDNTYSNMQEARLALWEENIIPLLDKYADALSNWLSHWYQEDLIVDFDRESISVLTKRRENLWSKISSANFMTTNEKRSFVGLGPIDGGDKI